MPPVLTSQGKTALVDLADLPLVCQYRWHVIPDEKTWYAGTIVRIDGRQTTLLMHQLLLDTKGTGLHVDHRNGDGWDNRRDNLRVATRSQNQANRRKQAGSSRFKGVTLRPSGRWQAQIQVAGRGMNLGLFDDEEEAARAYDRAARLHFGEFARCNFERMYSDG